MNDPESSCTLRSCAVAAQGFLPDPGLLRDPFVLVNRVDRVQAGSLVAYAHLAGKDGQSTDWQIVEACAQTACLHQRFLRSFGDQVFLLCVDEACIPGPIGLAALAGEAEIAARLTGQSSAAASYVLSLRPAAGRTAEREVHVALTVGHTPYASPEQAERLGCHYRRIWKCLANAW